MMIRVLFPQMALEPDKWRDFEPDTRKPHLRILLLPEKRSYALNETLYTEIRIINESPHKNPFSFRIDGNFFSQFYLTVRNALENETDYSLKYKQWLFDEKNSAENTSGENAGRERVFTILHGESVSFRIAINDWFAFEETGMFYISGFFKPQISLSKDNYSFEMIPSSFHIISGNPVQDKTVEIQKDAAQQKNLRDIPPYKIVEMHLKAQQRENWDDYLSVLDLVRFLHTTYASTEIYERYRGARADEKKILINEFQSFLIKSIDYRITEFEIIESSIKKDIAVVRVALHARSATQNYDRKLNPVTGQIEVLWNDGIAQDFFEKNMYYFSLHLNSAGEWKIYHKEVELAHPKEKERTYQIKDKHFIPPEEETLFDTPANITFYRGTPDITRESLPGLEIILGMLEKNPEIRIALHGHTDNTGPYALNKILSYQRAAAIRSWLIARGIAPERVTASGFGPDKPLPGNDNSTEELRKLNRRVEIHMFPSES